ncbi:alpha/beta fold hydrolase [Azospirillum rugosum]|uniref:Pimeloyl-ACP methyl ester carboxylesterase n=1 Tax=Azospirillum rugosum TaxID=416170 RepID=A0ABS4SW55_9PROT|nr:alpha/beta hydrolase [Azospirillum rugosum]MBP2296792.1 pimeloyl-ACP methyl ester carboxylesterase [Azospirillum rugosum]MDQ0530395.1 pimeloyl-ACP methyl ester carboxylesterase [Azospirillum rugosum]
MQVRYCTLNGEKSRYYEAGSGPPILLLHGVGSSADSWIRTAEALSGVARVIAPDLPGHGFTPARPYEGAPQGAMMEHILALIDHLELRRFSVGGSSFGAMLALLTYFARKESVERIVLTSSATATLPDEERLAGLKQAYNASIAAYRAPSLESVIGRSRNLFFDPDKVSRELALLQLNIFAQPGMEANFEKLLRGLMDMEAVRPYRVDHRFGEIAVPLLMIWGLQDRQVNVHRAIEAARQAAEAYFVGMENCGHVPHLEHPERVHELMAAFLSGESLAQYRV